MTRFKRLSARLVPSKVFYLWERFNLKRIELFTTDIEKKPEIQRDIKKHKTISTIGSFGRAHQQHLDEEERRRKKRYGY